MAEKGAQPPEPMFTTLDANVLNSASRGKIRGMEPAREVPTESLASSTPRFAWLPITVAAVAAAVAALWMLQWLLAVAVLLSSSSAVPQGVFVLEPTAVDVALAIGQHVGLPLLAIALFIVTLLSGRRGPVDRCWVVAIATVGVTAGAVLL